MTFAELLVQVRELLQSKGRVSYRALKLQFNLDDEYLDGLKDELIEAERIAADEDGKVLVWIGKGEKGKGGKGERGEDFRLRTPNSELRTSQTPNSELIAAERRQLTVMFCDLVGSTALSAQLDPEELREVIRGYQQTSATVIERFGGHIAQYLGDGLLVYFGYPGAHEDDAARAVRAGVEIIQAMQLFSSPSPSQGEGWGEGSVGVQFSPPHPNPLPRGARGLRVRIGIHTGPVVIGEMGGGAKREQLALGETPNLAARIQGHAHPDEVLISAATYHLVEGLFECEDRGQPELKGIATPLTLYRVVAESQAQSRFEVVARKGLTPLIGRDHEFGLLRELWARVKEGAGQVVLLSGEPGIGKSRLVEALKESVAHEGARCWELRCSPYHQNSALYPVIEHLQRAFGLQSNDSSEEKLRRVEASLVGAYGHTPLRELVPLFAALLSLPLSKDYVPLSLSPQKQKEKTHEALVTWLCGQAKQHALVYAWEDLHWADPSTLELLTLFLNHVPTARLLAVLTYRLEFTAPWGSHSHLSQLTLSRLGRNHVAVMVENVTGGTTLPQEVVQQIVNKTDGVPLFVEELTKTVLESVGSSESIGSAIPATLQDSLMARLDRLGPAKEIAQLGATIGREFDYALLQTVSPLNKEALQQGLKQLVEAELMYQSGVLPQARYLFKHALVQETAYQSLLKSTRQQYHKKISQALEDHFSETKETQPELLARHYTEAGLIEQALPYWQKAGERATQRAAYVEAIAHLSKGLEVLKILPDTLERARKELSLQIVLSLPLTATRGYAAPDVESAYARAHLLCQMTENTLQLFPALRGLWQCYFARGEARTAHEMAIQLLPLAERAQDPTLLMSAYQSLGLALFALGKLDAARTALEQGIAFDQQQQHIRGFINNPTVNSLSYLAWTLWYLGYPDQALRRAQEALALAREMNQPLGLAFALYWAAMVHWYRGERQTVRERAGALLTLANEHGLRHFLAQGAIIQGWALAEQGQLAEGVTITQRGMEGYRRSGAGMGLPYYLGWLATAKGKVGQVAEGLTMLAEALKMATETAQGVYEVNLHRLKGELMIQQYPDQETPVSSAQSRESETEDCFWRAITMARQQHAKSLELRAATSLARLWQQQGKHKEAHLMLAEVYHWFTEGFDTKDLQEAKALLVKLDKTQTPHERTTPP